MSTALQLPIEFIEYEVTELGRAGLEGGGLPSSFDQMDSGTSEELGGCGSKSLETSSSTGSTVTYR
jgi:hypothetical protein